MGPWKIARLLPLAAVIIVPAAARASEQPLLLPPSSSWVVDYAEDSCALRRTFGDGRINAILEMRQIGPGNGYEITIGSDSLPRTRQAPRIRYKSDEAGTEPTLPSFVDGGGWHGVRFSDSLRPALPIPSGEAWPVWPNAERDARETAVTELTVADSFERELTLQVGRMHAPLDAMRACMRELVTHWGLDGEIQGALSRTVQPVRQIDWSRRTMDDYPLDMLRQGKSARVPIRLIIGTDGKPTSCTAAEGSAESSFEKAACASAMRYARFEPALDADGHPVASYFLTTIVYQVRP
jgi:TonB family protein